SILHRTLTSLQRRDCDDGLLICGAVFWDSPTEARFGRHHAHKSTLKVRAIAAGLRYSRSAKCVRINDLQDLFTSTSRETTFYLTYFRAGEHNSPEIASPKS